MSFIFYGVFRQKGEVQPEAYTINDRSERSPKRFVDTHETCFLLPSSTSVPFYFVILLRSFAEGCNVLLQYYCRPKFYRIIVAEAYPFLSFFLASPSISYIYFLCDLSS